LIFGKTVIVGIMHTIMVGVSEWVIVGKRQMSNFAAISWCAKIQESWKPWTQPYTIRSVVI